MNDPYLYEDSNVIRNLANIKDPKKLDDYESIMVNLGMIKLLTDDFSFKTVGDIFLIHKTLFENVYKWAGKSRTINIYKEEQVLNGLSVEYANYKNIKKELNRIQKKIDQVAWSKLSKNEMITEVARVISKIWQIHSFREGNTRVVSLFLYFFLKNLGFKVNYEFIGKHAKYFRNALVLASIGEYSEYNYLEEILKDSVSFKKFNSFDEAKYQTIRGYNLEKYEYNYHSSKKDDE